MMATQEPQITYPLLGPLGINHGTTPPITNQKKLTTGTAIVKDVFNAIALELSVSVINDIYIT